MRYSILILSAAVLVGCQSTRLIDVYPGDRQWIEEINQRAVGQKANVTLDTRWAPFNGIRGLYISEDSVRFDGSDMMGATALAHVREIKFPSKGGMGIGAAIGAAAGGFALGMAATAGNDDEWLFSDSEAFGFGFLVGGLGGALLGAAVGSAVATPGVTYSFQRGTPQQFSVVIGVSPLVVGQQGR